MPETKHDYPCHSKPQSEWCDKNGPGDFMGHTCHIRTDEHLETDLRIEDRTAQAGRDQARYGAQVNILDAITAEVVRASQHGASFASLHEAYAVILEEVDEVWEITRQKRCLRDELELRKEFIQIAAMAVKALQSMENFTGGKV